MTTRLSIRCIHHRIGDGGAFYLPCCWETLAAIAACDHCCGVRPTISSGGPPPRAPAVAGHFSARSIGRASNGLRVPIAHPHHSVPHARQSGPPPSNRISEISVRLFMARTLAPLPFCPLDLFLGRRCEKQATLRQVKFAPFGNNWNGFRISGL